MTEKLKPKDQATHTQLDDTELHSVQGGAETTIGTLTIVDSTIDGNSATGEVSVDYIIRR